MTQSASITAICSSFPPPRLEVFISFSFAALPHNIFLLICSTQVALLIFLLRTPVFVLPCVYSQLFFCLLKGKIKMIAVCFCNARTREYTNVHRGGGYITICCVRSVAGKNDQDERLYEEEEENRSTRGRWRVSGGWMDGDERVAKKKLKSRNWLAYYDHGFHCESLKQTRLTFTGFTHIFR